MTKRQVSTGPPAVSSARNGVFKCGLQASKLCVCRLSALSQQKAIGAASHDGKKEPECGPLHRPRPAARTVPQLLAAPRLPSVRAGHTVAPSSRRDRAPRRPPTPDPGPRRYLRTPSTPARRVGPLLAGPPQAGCRPLRARRAPGALPGRDSPGLRRPARHAAAFLRHAAPTPFVVTSSHGNRAARRPPALRDPAP